MSSNDQTEIEDSPLVKPSDQLDYLVQRGRGIEHPPEQGMILVCQNHVFRSCVEEVGAEKKDRFRPGIYIKETEKGPIGLCGDFGFGGPSTTMILELLIASGVERFFFIGSAGAIQPSLKVGDIILGQDAIRDDGVSYHYLDPKKEVESSSQQTSKWRSELERLGKECSLGTSWTTAAPFREMKTDVETYRNSDVLCVEMEAASIYAVAEFRGVDVSCGFVISDTLVDGTWKPQFHYASATESQIDLFRSAFKILSES